MHVIDIIIVFLIVLICLSQDVLTDTEEDISVFEYEMAGEARSLHFGRDLDNVAATVHEECKRSSMDRFTCQELFRNVVIACMSSGIRVRGSVVRKQFIAFADQFLSMHVPLIPRGDSLSSDVMSEYGMYDKDKSSVKNLRLLLCISHYEEGLHWVGDIHTPFIIVSKTIQDHRIMHVPVNQGNEVSSYLLYITEYYEFLPEYTLFLHGHERDWHQLYNLYFIVNHLRLDQGYHNINNFLVDDRNISTNKYMQQLYSLWGELFQDELGDFPLTGFKEKCCAQFVVHRDRIRLRSRHFYQRLYDFVISDHQDDAGDVDGYHSSMSFVVEFIWHYIFGEPAVKDYPGALYIYHNETIQIYL